ncbi:MAG TPA: sulfatase-like hydrolase/transferase [Candidatus Hydrogenedentes bacterium]|nr:sulfatase-like hydrolase/transferase [Candidatus Hydrogenedentota bacterium]
MTSKIKYFLLSAALFLAMDTAATAFPPPNIVLIVLDALRADRLDAERGGQGVMPALLDWSSHSVRFTNATTACTWTRPAMASVFTSLHVDAHQVYTGTSTLPSAIETMATFFNKAGYATIGIQSNNHLTFDNGFAQGFDIYDDDSAPILPADELTNNAIARIETAGQPFFLYIHYMDPHLPFWPPEVYRALFGYPNPGLLPAEQTIAENFYGYLFDQIDYTLGLIPARTYAELSATGKDAVWTLFDGDCRFTDTEVMRLILSIAQTHPDTIFVVTADHGEHMFEHGHLGHGLTVYEPVFRVPLIVNGPGLAPATVPSVVTTVDLLPTLAALAGLPPRPAWQGKDLFGTRDPDGPVFAYTRGGAAPRWVNLETVRRGSMKLIHNLSTGARALYNVENDPGETNNLASLYPEQAAELQALLDTHREDNLRARTRTTAITPHPNGWIEEGMVVSLTAPDGSNYQWKKDGADIVDAPPRVTGATTRTITLSPVVPEDAGVYECRFDDGAKSIQYTRPYILNVLPPNSVPAASPIALLVLATAIVVLSKEPLSPGMKNAKGTNRFLGLFRP